MKRAKIVTVGFSRENQETGEEFTYRVKCRVSLGAAATRLDPEDPGEVEIQDMEPVDGGPDLDDDDLTSEEREIVEDRATDAAAEEPDTRGYED